MILKSLKNKKRAILRKKEEGLKAGQTLQILGVSLNSTQESEVLKMVLEKIEKGRKFWIVTPNPEFLVYAQKNPHFRKILNSADLAIPDGFGLVLASWFLKTKPLISKRITGADLTEKLLAMAKEKKWRVGIVGARRGERREGKELVKKIKERYPGLKIEVLEEMVGWQKRKYEIIFACHGRGEQEKWIFKNLKKANASIFIGVGGSLDYIGRFSRRAPFFLRKLGLEWLWRLILKPSHLKRVFISCVIFPLLVVKEKLKI